MLLCLSECCEGLTFYEKPVSLVHLFEEMFAPQALHVVENTVHGDIVQSFKPWMSRHFEFC